MNHLEDDFFCKCIIKYRYCVQLLFKKDLSSIDEIYSYRVKSILNYYACMLNCYGRGYCEGWGVSCWWHIGSFKNCCFRVTKQECISWNLFETICLIVISSFALTTFFLARCSKVPYTHVFVNTYNINTNNVM